MTVLTHPTVPASWLESPPIVAARAVLARKLALLVAGLTLGLFMIDRFLGVPLDANSYLSLALAGVGVMAWYLLRKQFYVGVAWFLVACLFSIAALSTYFFGSVRTVDIALILVGQVAVGLFLSRQALVWTTLGASALMGVLAWADAQGLLMGKPDFDVGLRTFFAQAACVVGVAAMVYLNRTQMRTAQELHVQEAHQRIQAQLDRDQGYGRFKRLFLTSPTPIFVQSAQTGRILDVNPACERALGYPRKALLDKRDGFLWVHDQAYEHFVRERRSSLRTEWLPVTAIRESGEHLPVLICRERDDDPREKLVITFMRMLGDQTASGTVSPPQGVESSSWGLSSEGHSSA